MSISNTEKHVKDIRRNTRRKFSSEEKIRIVLDGLRGEYSMAELCRREGINANLYYRGSKEFLEAGKKRLSGDTVREASSDEVVDLKKENNDLKQVVAELYLRNNWHVEDRGIRHVYIKARTPQLNGKVERSHRSDQDEFYQLLDYRDDVDLEKKLAECENFYHFARPHGATPYASLRERLT